MVEEVRERVIRAAAYRPYEGGKRVFVVEAAEAMRDESQNALLKTLEEPPAFVHLILLSSEPEALLETIASRCQPIDFAPLPAEAIEAMLREDAPDAEADELAAAARLSAGDLELARLLLTDQGRALREQAVAREWGAMLKNAEAAGEEAESATREALEEEKEAGMKRSARDIERRGKTRRPPPPHRAARARTAPRRRLVPRPRRGRLRRRRRRLQPRPPRPAPRSRRRPRPERRPPRRRAGRRHPPPPRPQRLRGAGPRGALVQACRRSRLSAPARVPSPAPAPGPGG